MLLGDENMGKYNWGFDLPDSFWTSQLKLNAIQLSNAASELSRVWESTLAGCDFGGIFAAAKQFAAISKSFSDMALSIESLWKQNDIFNTLQTVNVSDAFKNVDWSWVINAYTEAFRGEEDEEGVNLVTIDNDEEWDKVADFFDDELFSDVDYDA